MSVAARVARDTAGAGRAPGRVERLLRRPLGPALLAALLGALFVALEPPLPDLAAHDYRAGLFDRVGFGLWNDGWYAGHHTVGYSVLFPPLAAALGPTVAGALAAVTASALFHPLAHAHFGPPAWLGSLWFAVGMGTVLFTGRLPFALGVAFAVGALLALQRGRRPLTAALAVLCGLASPVAALFLALLGAAYAVSGPGFGRRRSPQRAHGLLLATAAFVPPLVLALAFPSGGYEPFVVSAFYAIPLLAAVSLIVVPPEERALRTGLVLYAAAAVAAFVIPTPMGGNAARLGSHFAGPVLACALLARTRLSPLLVAGVLLPLAYWQLSPPARELARAYGDPSARDAFYTPLIGFLEPRVRPGERVEIVFTQSHREAAVVAPRVPIARGWERQLDTARHSLFYRDGLDADTYQRWLREHAVRYVAVSDAPPDYSAVEEARLVRSRPAFLVPRFRSEHWRVYEVATAHPFVVAQGATRVRLASVGPEEVALRFRGRGAALVRVRPSPYWRTPGGCVEPADGWTRVTADRPGLVRMRIDFSPERMVLRGRRCE